MDKHAHCRGQVKFARIEAKEKGIGLLMIKSQHLQGDDYAVFCDNIDMDYGEYSACCAFDARAQFIYDYIDFKTNQSSTDNKNV